MMKYLLAGVGSVCRETICFVYGVSTSTIKNISASYKETKTVSVELNQQPWQDSHVPETDLGQIIEIFDRNLVGTNFDSKAFVGKKQDVL
jgi:hypothetical protein